MAPPGCEDAPGLVAPRVPANAGVTGNSAIVSSGDPNDKVGPAGFGVSDFVADSTLLPYRIDFENASTATAPAQEVVITDQLSSNVDWSSFRIAEIGWGDLVLAIPPDSQHYQTTVPMTYNGETFDVLVQIGINLSTGLITAQFFSVDPLTELPPDVLAGFLPPEDGTGRGMGHISYTIQPKANLATGTQIRNVADVSFDEQQIIATDQVSETDPTQGTDPTKEALVTIDAGPPTSSVAALPAQESSTTFTVTWSGQDDAGGSGIAFYDIYVSDNGGPFTLFQSETTASSASFTGQNGHCYGFYSVATDIVGNRESLPSGAQASTTVVIPAQLTVSSIADSGAGSLRQAILDANSASGTPHTILFQLPAGPQAITLLTPLPTATDPLTLSLDATQNVTVALSSGSSWNDGTSLIVNGAGALTVGGGIEGAGDLTVGAGSSLTASHIIQSALVIGGSAGSPALVTIAASDANGNPLNAVATSNTGTAIYAIATSSQLTPPTAGTASAVATASTLTSITASTEPPITVAVAVTSLGSSGSASAVKSNFSDSGGVMALQSSSETGGVSDLVYPMSNESERPSSLRTTGVSSTSDAATFLGRHTAIVADGTGNLLSCDAVAAASADADILEWAASTPAARPSAADSDFSQLSDDLLAAVGRRRLFFGLVAMRHERGPGRE